MEFTLEQARKYAGLSQVEMAEKLEMSERWYIQFEKGRQIFRIDLAYKFAELTGVPFNSIIFFEGQLQTNCN